jgi:DNA polymerase I-like protein with 3'-5' exonuclease and polymerase domains
MRMTVHDSLEVDLHEPETLPAYAAALNEQRLALRVPLLWDVKTGPTWGDC